MTKISLDLTNLNLKTIGKSKYRLGWIPDTLYLCSIYYSKCTVQSAIEHVIWKKSQPYNISCQPSRPFDVFFLPFKTTINFVHFLFYIVHEFWQFALLSLDYVLMWGSKKRQGKKRKVELKCKRRRSCGIDSTKLWVYSIFFAFQYGLSNLFPFDFEYKKVRFTFPIHLLKILYKDLMES